MKSMLFITKFFVKLNVQVFYLESNTKVVLTRLVIEVLSYSKQYFKQLELN